jgi:glutathione synthase/RimK-type ligase-like ATP-grasp enzyme
MRLRRTLEVQQNLCRTSRICRTEDLTTIWWRRPSSHLKRSELDFPSLENLDRVETYWALRWLIEAQPSIRFPFSHPLVIERANNKILQLRIAEEIGFITPQTLFTNDKACLSAFARNAKEVVLKPLRSSLARNAAEDKTINIIARPISHERLGSAMSQQESGIAAFCQARVRKRADLRVNVFPSLTIGCEIDTREMPEQEVDWRPQTNDYAHEIVEVPKSIDQLCRNFISELGLNWGIFDFGLTQDDQWVFLECNPNAQWLWIEFKTGVALSEIVAEELLRHHSSTSAS